MRSALWAIAFAAVAVPAWAQPVLVRLGTHAGLGRVVYEFGDAPEFTTERTPNGVTLHFPGAGPIPSGDGTARNVVSVEGGADTATLMTVPDAKIRVSRLGTRVVVDVTSATAGQRRPAAPVRKRFSPTAPVRRLNADEVSAARQVAPPPAQDAEPAVATASSPAIPPVPTPVMPPRPVLDHPQGEAAGPPPEPTTVAPSAAAPPSEPMTLAVTRLPAPAGMRGSLALVPFGPGVGAAAFRHGDQAWIVFDERRPLDVKRLGDDPVFAGAEVDLLPAATLLRIKSDGTAALRLERRADGWAITPADPLTPGSTAMPVIRPARMIVPAAAAGQVVAVPDPDTGRNLLVGTIKATGPGIPVGLRVPEFAILESWQGLVVDPVSDRTSMRTIPEGFAVQTGSDFSPAPENAAALAKASVLTRRFDIPAEPVAALLRRLQTQVQDVGRAPAQSRLAPRKAAAQTMLALGLAAEAQSSLQAAAADDPRAASDPELKGLTAIAALLNGRVDEATGLDTPELTGSDEIGLWRAVRSAMQTEGSATAAPVLAADAGLVLAYPSALRNRLLPLVAENLALAGETQAVDALLGRLPDEPLLAFARAIRLEQRGDTGAALALFDALAQGRDRLSSARAATRATLLRLATGEIGQAEAADRLERSFVGWRGDARERDLRRMTADMQAKAGQWRRAFATLRDTAQLFPADAPAITARLTAMVGDLLRGSDGAAMKPLDFVALAAENADAIAKADEPGMAVLIADKLVALDLPTRADPVIERLIAASPTGAGRAALGSRLAALRLGEGNPDGAASALAATAAPDLPPDLEEERGLTEARIDALAHKTAAAAAVLSRLGGQQADELRATILSDAGDWHGAALALAAAANRAVPDSGPLTPPQQDLLLRLASAQSRAEDTRALQELGMKQAARITGPRAAMFRLLTSAPVKAVGDLRRSAGDIALARALPSTLNAIGAR